MFMQNAGLLIVTAFVYNRTLKGY